MVAKGNAVQQQVLGVSDAAEKSRQELASRLPPSWGVDDQGNYELDENGYRVNLSLRVRLPEIDVREWRRQAQEVLERGRPAVEEAVDALDEELAVLRMTGGVSLLRGNS